MKSTFYIFGTLNSDKWYELINLHQSIKYYWIKTLLHQHSWKYINALNSKTKMWKISNQIQRLFWSGRDHLWGAARISWRESWTLLLQHRYFCLSKLLKKARLYEFLCKIMSVILIQTLKKMSDYKTLFLNWWV